MTTYADPTRCPDCSAALGPSPRSCPMCGIPLSGPTAFELFAALTNADRALAVLRQERGQLAASVTAPSSASTAPSSMPPGAEPSGSLLAGAEAFPVAAAHVPPARPRLTGASVPKILLSLGALCLLVAAVTFLAVAWSWLGVGGRTVVLVALTGASLAVTGLLHRRDLRIGAESLSVVGLGLVALDVVGARHAGWIGTITDAHLVSIASTTLAVVALGLLGVTRTKPLFGAAVIAPLGVLAATAGTEWDIHGHAPVAVAVVVLVALARLGRALPSVALAASALLAAGLAWVWLVVGALSDDATPYTVAHLWGDLAVWPLLAAVVTMALVAPAAGLGRRVLLGTAAVAALLATYVVVLAALDNSPTASTSCLLAAAVVWAAVVVIAPAELRRPAAIPLAGVLPAPLVALLALVGTSVEAVLSVGSPFSRSFGVHVAESTPWVASWLTIPSVVVVAGAACALTGLVTEVRRTAWVAAAGTGLALGALIAIPLYDVPLAVSVGLLVVLGVGALALAERVTSKRADASRGVAVVVLGVAAVAALPSDLMTACVLLVVTVAAGILTARTDVTGEVASALLPLAFAGLVWSAAEVAAVPDVFRAAPVLLALGALAIWRPEPVLEAASAAAGLVVSAAAVTGAHDVAWALTIHLTLAGALVTTSSTVHPSRRSLAWVGGLLLAMATWVRLVDLGVHTPEAYTLPSALVLVALGAVRLGRDREAATATMLMPGLTLATVPSLLVALEDPFSLRALLLGAGCLVLVLGGISLRWNAPLVVGAAVGALLVLRELAPYASTVPPWLLIGLSGTLLTVVGVTWESRMGNVRSAGRYVGSLR